MISLFKFNKLKVWKIHVQIPNYENKISNPITSWLSSPYTSVYLQSA